MRAKISAALLLACSASISGHAFAACNGTALTGDALGSLLSGKTVCAAYNGDQWQEFHQPGGDLIDYKKGPTDPIDPSETVGSWSVTGGNSVGTVTYNYGPGSEYGYQVHPVGNSGKYDFCGAVTISQARLVNGKVACP